MHTPVYTHTLPPPHAHTSSGPGFPTTDILVSNAEPQDVFKHIPSSYRLHCLTATLILCAHTAHTMACVGILSSIQVVQAHINSHHHIWPRSDTCTRRHIWDAETKCVWVCMCVCVCCSKTHPHLHAFNLFLMQANMPTSTHTHTCTRTWHDVCLNNRFLVQCVGLLGVWLEPLGDLSAWAKQAPEPLKVCFWFQRDTLRTPEFLAKVCTLLHPLDPHPWNVWHTHSHRWEHEHTYAGRKCRFSKSA